MNNKILLIIKYYFVYILFLLILKNINYLLFISFESLIDYWFVFIPISYIAVKYFVYYDLEKTNFVKKDIIWYISVGFTIINIFFSMPYIYTFSILVFLIICKDKETFNRGVIYRNIQDYYEDKKRCQK